jgi:hypothetical protein
MRLGADVTRALPDSPAMRGVGTAGPGQYRQRQASRERFLHGQNGQDSGLGKVRRVRDEARSFAFSRLRVACRLDKSLT